MKFWLDTTLTDQLSSNGAECRKECPTECSKDCPDDSGYTTGIRGNEGFSGSIDFPLTEGDIHYIKANIFQKVKSLHMQTYAGEYALICSPTGSGKIAVLDAEAAYFLEQFSHPTSLTEIMQSFSALSEDSLATAVALLYRSGFLQNTREPSCVQKQGESDTLSAWLHVTNACNLRCDYCYLDKTSEHMADDTALRAIDAIFRSAIKHHFKSVRLQYAGGEASLQMARVVSIHNYALALAEQYGLSLSAYIMSNGVFLSQSSIKFFKAHNIDIMISLDGIGYAHDSQRPFINGRGSFKYVDRTISQLLANNIVPHISVTVSQRNLSGLPDLINYILERNMPFTLNYYRDNDCSTYMRDLQFAEEQMITTMRSVFALIERNPPKRRLLGSLIDKASLQSIHHRTCSVGRNYLVIDQHGGIAKCQADIKRTVTTIAVADPLLLIRNDRNGVQGYSVDEKEDCRICEWRYWCTGGCPLLTYRMTGRNDIKSPNCNIYKALFPDILNLEALRLLTYEPPFVL